MASMIYLIGLMDSLIVVLSIIFFILIIILLSEGLSRKLIYCLIMVALLLVVIPNDRTLYLMFSAHYLSRDDIPSKVRLLLNKKLDEYLKDDEVRDLHLKRTVTGNE